VASQGHHRSRLALLLHEVVDELRKVVWPSAREVRTYAIVVVVVITAVTTIVFGFDQLFSRLTLRLIGP
jgi:preprotein translocase SecE subunit